MIRPHIKLIRLVARDLRLAYPPRRETLWRRRVAVLRDSNSSDRVNAAGRIVVGREQGEGERELRVDVGLLADAGGGVLV